jgi:hypothetical protein
MKMRCLPVVLSVLLAGCAGNVADYVGPRAGIVSPQLIRFGLTLDQSRCVGERLGASLSPLQLRHLTRAASATRRGADPARLTVDDLVRVAGAVGDPKVRPALVAANEACEVVAAAAAPAPAAGDAADAGPAASTGAPRPPAWLNLGAAPSGQALAIDAATIEQQASTRTAWFRLTEPGSAIPGQNTYLLRVDCSNRTISEKARRKPDGTGATVEVPGDDKPVAIERNTVMEIAWLALCT